MSEDYQKRFNREELSLNEKEVIDILVDWHDKSGKQDLRHLKHFVTPDLELQEYFEIKGLYVGTNILRQEFGFNKNEKPGDFDIIIIPYSVSGIHFERTAVCEVKIVRPTRQKPQKNANSLGLTQLKGLIKDGFPFIGLIHISLTEPLKDHEKLTIDYCKLPVGDYTPFEKGKTFKDYLVKVKYDHFQWYSVDKQMQRLVSSEIPKYVGLLCFGLSQKDNDYWLETVSAKYSDFEKGYFNPNLSEETILKVANHFKNNPSKYIKK